MFNNKKTKNVQENETLESEKVIEAEEIENEEDLEEVKENKTMIVLTKPIMINGKEVDKLEYDFENMTAKDKINIGKRIKQDGVPISVEELDSDYHLYLFGGAVVKANPSYDISDVLRLSAKDARKGAMKARDFFYLGLDE
ncbi:MAG: hypothetical protein FH761_17885 [Firmicutes bacterium]|nr:hypothetical protein [Bacillota bacterium]